jgi:hypothetical protein
VNRSRSILGVSAFFISLFLTAAAVAAPVRLSTISVSPGAVLGGNAAIGTATLTSAAGHGGVVVTLSSSNTAVATVPANVAVPQGATSATFNVSTSPVNASTSVTLTGNYGVNATASFTVTRPAVSSLSISPSSFTALTGSASGTVSLDGRAGSSGVVVTLTHTGTFVTMPSSVTVPAGEMGTAFNITSSQVASTTTVTVTASANGNTAVASVDVSPCTMGTIGNTISGSNSDIVWFDDTLPAGMSLGTAQWSTAQTASGSQSLTTGGGTGYQSFQLTGATTPFTLYDGEQMYLYVLTNSCTPPHEIMVGFHTTTGQWKKAYLGSALIGGESTAYNAGAAPYPGLWTTLYVSAQQLGLPNGAQLDGFSLELSDGQAWVDRIEKTCHQPTAAAPSLPAGDTYWIDDSFPSGTPGGGYLTRWDTTQHASGTQSLMQYAIIDNTTLPVYIGDTLIAYVLLDYCWPGQEIDIRYITSYQESKGVYWGASTWNNAGYTYMGPLPSPGQWVRLEIPAAAIGIEERTITSIAAYGNAWWDLIGKSGQGCSFPTAAAPSIPAGDTLILEDSGGIAHNGGVWTAQQHASGDLSLTLPYATSNGYHWVSVTNVYSTVTPTFGETLVFYALLDPCAPPTELTVQWNIDQQSPISGMYWGTPHGIENGYVYMGPLPSAGSWQRFEVPVTTVNAQGQLLRSIKYEWEDGNAYFDHIGKGGTACYTAAAAQPTNFSGSDVVWIDDDLPYGAGFGNPGWDTSQKASGTRSMAQSYASGLHDMQVNFMNGAGYPVGTGETLTFYVLLDECAPPTEVMFRWLTSTGVTKGAYWGTPHNLGEGNPYISMGALPPAGVWTRIDIPASELGLDSTTIQGLDLISYDGHTFFDRIGKSQ